MSRTAGVVLCGGMSRRMGRPKAWLPFGRETLLARTVRRLLEAVDDVVVVAAPGQPLPPIGDVRVVHDPTSGQGPLRGIATGLQALADSIDTAYATAVDAPFLEPRWISLLHERLGDAEIAWPESDGFVHPLAALYRRSPVLNAALALLAAERYRPLFLSETLATRVLTPADLESVDPERGTLRNLNTPDDYRAALRDAGEADRPTITFELFGVPRLRAGIGRIDLSAGRVDEALAALLTHCPALGDMVLSAGRVAPAYRLCLNAEMFDPAPDTLLVEGDSLLLMAADVGG